MPLALVFRREATLSRLVLAVCRVPEEGRRGGGEEQGEARGVTQVVKVRGEPTRRQLLEGEVMGCGPDVDDTQHDDVRDLPGFTYVAKDGG